MARAKVARAKVVIYEDEVISGDGKLVPPPPGSLALGQ